MYWKEGWNYFFFHGLQVKWNSCEIGQEGVSGFAPFFLMLFLLWHLLNFITWKDSLCFCAPSYSSAGPNLVIVKPCGIISFCGKLSVTQSSLCCLVIFILLQCRGFFFPSCHKCGICLSNVGNFADINTLPIWLPCFLVIKLLPWLLCDKIVLTF